jgi:hypothetical protein
MVQFSEDVKAWVNQTDERIRRFKREYVQDLAQVAIDKTPVQTGFLRSNWWLSIGQARARKKAGKDFGGNEQAASAQAFNNIAIKAQDIQGGETVYILNGASYARAVNDGTGNRRGAKMVEQAVQKSQRIADGVVTRLKGGRSSGPTPGSD